MRLVGRSWSSGALVFAQAPGVVRVPMRDGVRLSTNVFLPRAPGKYPTLLDSNTVRQGNQPHRRISGVPGPWVRARRSGCTRPVRERGSFQPPVQEDHDGEDTLNWIARQTWSDGSVGMLGGSYLGHRAMAGGVDEEPAPPRDLSRVAGSDEYLDRYYSPGGAMKLGHRLQWIAENLDARSATHVRRLRSLCGICPCGRWTMS